MASFESVLSAIGNTLKKFFTEAVVVAKSAEPFIDVCFPGIGILYNTTVNAVAQAETAAIAAGSQSGTGVQKLAYVVAAIDTDFKAYATAQGIKYDDTTVTNWVNAVVATLNGLPKI